MSNTLLSELFIASGETLYMVFISAFIALILGLPLGAFLFALKKINAKPKLYRIINLLVNFTRSIPFIILLLLLIPLTRALIGTSIGTTAAIVPLTISAIPFMAKLCENAFNDIPHAQLEMGLSLGATAKQIILKILLPDALPMIINAATVTTIALVAYSAMAGTVGGGGLGDLAIRYGYQRFNLTIMIFTVLILVIMVQSIQFIGDKISHRFSH